MKANKRKGKQNKRQEREGREREGNTKTPRAAGWAKPAWITFLQPDREVSAAKPISPEPISVGFIIPNKNLSLIHI